LGGLIIPKEGIICPFNLTIALASEALINGVILKLNFPVIEIKKHDGFYEIISQNKVEKTKSIINAAGLNSSKIDSLMGYNRFEIIPRRGELIVFDKSASSLISSIILPVPPKKQKAF